MFVIFNKDGSVFAKTQSDFIMQGSNKVNKVYVGFVDNDYTNWSCNAVFNLPNETRTTIPALEVAGGFDYLGVNYKGWEISLTDEVTRYSGVATMTIQVVSGETNVLFTYLTNITINRTGLPLSGYWDDSITVAQFNSYMAQLAVKLQANTVSVEIKEEDLPEAGEKNVLYFIIGESSNTPYQVKMWNGSEYTLLGTINLSSFASKEQQDAFENMILNRQNDFERDINAAIAQIRSEVVNPFEVVQTTSQLPSTNTGKIYVVIADNKWYYWNGSEYVIGAGFVEAGLSFKPILTTALDEALADQLLREYENGDKRPFTMYIETFGDWKGKDELKPVGEAIGFFYAEADSSLFITAKGMVQLANNGESYFVSQAYDNTNSDLKATNVQEAIDELDFNKANKDGFYAPMGVGYSQNIIAKKGFETSVPISLTEAGLTSEGYVASIVDGFVEIKGIKGRTLFVNQLVNLVETKTAKGLTITNNGDGSITISGTTIETGFISITKNIKTISGNKYVCQGFPQSTSDYVFDNASYLDIPSSGNGIASTTRDENTSIYINVKTVGVEINLTFKPRITDLTKMFGAGKEPTTVAEFNNLTRYLDTDTYNEGTPISMTANEIVSIGFNAFDGELELGYITAEGQPSAATPNAIRCKNFIPVVCGEKYTVSWDSTQLSSVNEVSIVEFDKNYNYIAKQGANTNPTVKTLSDRTIYIKIYFYKENYFTTIPENLNICFHLTHSGYRNGQFEPHWKETRELPTRKYFPEGMKSAGNAYDILTPTIARKVIGSVDLGTLDWVYESSSQRFYSSEISNLKQFGYTEKPNILCVIYDSDTTYQLDQSIDKMICTNNSGTARLFIRDTAFTNATTFKQSLSGQILYFELAEPIETDVIDTFNPVMRVGRDGTISINKGVPPTVDLLYTKNLADFLEGISDRDDISNSPDSIVSQQQLLDAAGIKLYKHIIEITTNNDSTPSVLEIITTQQNDFQTYQELLETYLGQRNNQIIAIYPEVGRYPTCLNVNTIKYFDVFTEEGVTMKYGFTSATIYTVVVEQISNY